ncbi:OmpA family protein [Emticicia sp. CRIBPO]|uniref:OmpA family protein n=1 Tax=Emticicia sp. CRIBPO TaxID=2683258 RepID=UPI0014126C2F|nr:OmpA family protein [Emticicia sp. CRIBPO]NBA88027.1 OmpA family protein [Emticicia sp. CRIBPO]
MKKVLFFMLAFTAFGPAFSQITPNPKVARKSADYVFINKIEITDQYTILSMQAVIRSAKESLKDFLDKNPKQKQGLQMLDPAMRDMILKGMMGELQGGENTISFQPGAYLKSKDGRKFKFIKATDIPVAPERKNVEAGKKYFFKVYFEKLPKGVTTVDLIENSTDTSDGFVFWNFQGISVNNPANGISRPEESEPLAYKNDTEEFKLSGKVIDAATNKPVPARIICYAEDGTTIVDSVITSKSGYYEFLLPAQNYVYKITSPGYDAMEEVLGLKNFKNKQGFERDIFLEPKASESEEVKKEEILTPEEETVEPEKIEENKFRLNKVYFNIGEAVILEESFPQLDDLADHLKENPELRIRIEGHTDNQGDPALNKKLSMERAYNVREYLIKEGIAGKRIEFKGMGDTKPVSPNDTEENRKKNRRVEYTILE